MDIRHEDTWLHVLAGEVLLKTTLGGLLLNHE